MHVCRCAMPQYDDSFLLDCEKKRNVRSYRPHKKRFAISNGSGITKLSSPPTPPSPLLLHQQDNGTFSKWRKWYFTWKQQNASSIPSTAATATMPSMPIYRSMCSPNTNSTFNCKFSSNTTTIRPINIRIFMSFNSVNAEPRYIYVCVCVCVFVRLHSDCKFSTRMRIVIPIHFLCISRGEHGQLLFNWKLRSKYTEIICRYA